MAEAGATPGAGDRVHPRQRQGVRAGRASPPGLDVDDFAPRLSFFFVARTTLLEEIAKFRAARADLGAHHARRVRRQEPQVADAAVPHPDRRRAADRPAARGQPGPGRRAGPGRRPRRHPVAAHQLLRRGHRAADREGRAAGAADPAGHRLRDRRDQDRRPVRRVLRDRVDDRRPRGRGPRADPGRRGPRAARWPRSSRASRRTRSRTPPTASPSRSTTGRGPSSGVNKYLVNDEEPYEPLRVDPQIEAEQCERLAVLRAERDNAAVNRALDELRTTAAGTGNVLPPMREALRLAPPAARSPTRCATSGASTSRTTPSDQHRPDRHRCRGSGEKMRSCS